MRTLRARYKIQKLIYSEFKFRFALVIKYMYDIIYIEFVKEYTYNRYLFF